MSHQRREPFFDVSKNSSTQPARPQSRTRVGSRPIASSTATASARRTRSSGLFASTAERASVGLLFLEVASRRRYRVNGTVVSTIDDRVVVRVAEAYPNCPKYIQRRHLRIARDPVPLHSLREGNNLGQDERDLIAVADTFFVASAGPDHKLDASHRGGRPGFVRVDGDRLWIPDYAGNNMFNTLGNLALEPAAGLLFIDFGTGTTLQLCGTATIDLESDDPATGGTNRSWTFHTTAWQRSGLIAHLHSELLDASPHNP